ncbi:MAG: twin-arginine translocase subunit TatC [Planctomycetaceae bacterium]
MAKSKDLFDDTTMSFGEHLEALRIHLWKSLIALVVCVIFALFIGNNVIDIVRGPIDKALAKYGQTATEDVGGLDVWKNLRAFFGSEEAKQELEQELELKKKAEQADLDAIEKSSFEIVFKLFDLGTALYQADPKSYPKPAADDGKTVALTVQSEELGKFFKRLEIVDKNQHRPVTLQVQEAFMTYLKVAILTGLVLAGPYIFYQIWLFVAAGLYPHERQYVYVYFPFSLGLFIGGALFCFFLVFPFVLDFLLGYNARLGIQPQIRLSEWVSFAMTLPLMFGISFQLPMVMLFLERISIFDARAYREKRRLSILVIAIVSMVLTPSDPASMMLMMVPLVALYELGIILCGMQLEKRPTEIHAEG